MFLGDDSANVLAFMDLSVDRSTGQKLYTCKICNASSNRKYNISTHIARVHGPQDGVRCDFCEKVFKNIPTLQTHLKKKICIKKIVFGE